MKITHVEDARKVIAWFICGKCNNAKHRIFPGEKTPWWWCQDHKCQLSEGDEIEIEESE